MTPSARDSTTPPSPVEVVLSDHVATVELRRPPANYFDEHLIGTLVHTLGELDEDPACRAVVLCSQGKHFCAGADFGSGGFADDRATTARRLYRLAAGLFETRTPIIAAVQGAAVGGGLGLACAADFRVADAQARFVANFSLLGFHHGFGLSVTLPALLGTQHAADLLYRGGTLRGERAVEVGLADRLCAPGEQRLEALRWAREIAAAAPLAVASIRETLRRPLAERVHAALERELAEQSRLWQTDDSAEGIAAASERRRPAFTGR